MIYPTKFSLQTDRLILKDLENIDIDELYELGSDNDITRYLNFIKFINIDYARKWLNEKIYYNNQIPRKSYNLGIFNKMDHRFIGWIGIGEADSDSTVWDFGIAIKKKYWGKGYATEALRSVIDFCITELKVNKIMGDCDSENITSIKMMQKAGMRLVEKSAEDGKIKCYYSI